MRVRARPAVHSGVTDPADGKGAAAMSSSPNSALPTVAGCTLVTAGYDWDAIRVPRSIGLTAMGILGGRVGAVVEDPLEMALYFFVPTGTSDRWSVINTRTLGPGSVLPIPPPRRTRGPGPHWRIGPEHASWFTDPGALTTAIRDAFGKGCQMS
jgi:hypothetical protein